MITEAQRARRRETYAKNRDTYLASARKWRAANREKRCAYTRKWTKNNPEKKKAYMLKWAAENQEKRRIYNQKWYAENREQQREYRKQYHQKNAEKLNQYSREYCKKNREAFTEYGRQWRKANPEKFREAQRRGYVRAKQWRKENAVLMNMHKARRRERIKATIDKAAINVLSQLVTSASRLKCGICEKNMPKGDRTIDHIIPLARGGTGDVWNLRIVHHLCNIRKHATMPDELNFVGEAVRNCNTNPRSANTVADAQVEPGNAKNKEKQ